MRKLVLFITLCFTTFFYSQTPESISKKAKQAFIYCKKNKMNTSFCFLVNFSIHSGKNRFFIYSFKTNQVIYSGLVCHGVGLSSSEEKPVYSNVVGSNCTSLGKYKIGKRANSNWGINIHYKMHGLEKTNNNAFKRKIVLHSYDYVSETEIYPQHLTMGWSQGCPVIANNLMKEIDKLLKKQTKGTLLWVYDGE